MITRIDKDAEDYLGKHTLVLLIAVGIKNMYVKNRTYLQHGEPYHK